MKIRGLVREACTARGYDYGAGVVFSPRSLAHILLIPYESQDPGGGPIRL